MDLEDSNLVRGGVASGPRHGKGLASPEVIATAAPPRTETSGTPTRHFTAEINYEESWERRWLRKRLAGSWWSVVDCGGGGSSFVVAATLAKVKAEIIPGIRFLLEDDASTIILDFRYATPVTP